MPLGLYIVDAFASGPFTGNPAAVCLLDASRPDAWMQSVASEMNLSETAFLMPGKAERPLRWFTPAGEVPLCGHATLASAHILWETGGIDAGATARFATLSGTLTARRERSVVEIDLPASPLEVAPLPPGVAAALGVSPRSCGRTADRGLGDIDYLVELGSEAEVRAVRPDFARLRETLRGGVIVTAPAQGDEYDIVSRYFAPFWGIDEDPVTGAAHCALGPFWGGRLGRQELRAFQASRRGGRVRVRLDGDRVRLAGGAVTVVEGVLSAR